MNTMTAETERKDIDNVPVDLDPLRFEDFKRSELAIDTIARMLGFNLKDMMAEEAKDNPDYTKLNKLEKQRDTLLDEQRQIYYGNKIVMIACIENYCPIISSRYSS